MRPHPQKGVLLITRGHVPRACWPVQMSTVFNPTLRLLEEIKSGKKERGIVDGYITTVGVSEDNVHRLQAGLTPRPSDVFVVSFPKSGTTWMQQIVKLIWNGGKEDGRDANEALPWLELMTPEEAEVRPLYNT